MGRDRADLPVALDDAARALERPAEPAHGLLHDHDDPDPGRLGPEDAAAHGERLAGDDLRHGVADLHRVGVHHPGHRLLVGGHVGSGDVSLRADDRQELGGEPPRQALELSAGEVPRVAAHSALRAAVREAQKRALPGHPHRERGALAERHRLVVADPALRRAKHARMLDAIARVDAERAVVQANGNGRGEAALGIAEHLRDERVDPRRRERPVELADRLPEKRVVELWGELAAPGRGGLGRHALSLCGSRPRYARPPRRRTP